MTHCNCRFCGAPLSRVFADLGMSPLANSYLRKEQLRQMEPYYPLDAYVCDKCFLVQLDMYEVPTKIFTEYAYFSSFSSYWLQHCSEYTEMMIDRFQLDTSKLILEIGSNDGHLLKYFIEKNIPVLGIDPAANVADAAKSDGVPTLVRFFNGKLADELVCENKKADVIIGNNVLAHVPELIDFIDGMKKVLKPDGVITMEFPHLMKLIKYDQFDTIYHEHFSYFSLITVENIFRSRGLTIFDVDELQTHGGSIRIYASHSGNKEYEISDRVGNLKYREVQSGLQNINMYNQFSESVKRTKRNILDFLIHVKNNNRTIAGYSAAAKATTLLNYCGIGTDMLDYTVDISPYKQGLYLPGTHIPILHPDKLKETRPDYILIFSWNLKEEVIEQHSYVNEWNGKFVIPIPVLAEYDNNVWRPVSIGVD
jgi:2-polyprenyl-3-methyl-5-hydroxy-6-metoxy-1,4-benzoquinol methylase